VATLASSRAQLPEAPPPAKASVAYYALCLFSVFYFFRPEDFIPGMDVVPVGKILGAIGVLGLILGVRSRNRQAGWPLELKLLLALFAWQCLTIPFAFWRGGAFNKVISTCSKTVIIAFLVTLAVQSFDQLKRLLWIQALAVAVTAVASVLFVTGGSRLTGITGGVFSNPNDLAINIALNWPLCLMFLLMTRSYWKKALWAAALIFMLRGVMLTYSRSGFLAVAVAMVLCFWEFGIRGKRLYLVGGAVVLAFVALAVLPRNYTARLVSIVGVESTESMDQGSAGERKDLLLKSLAVTATHPLFGLGPGNFEPYSGAWRVTHNTYTEVSSECGIPALILFLAILFRAFRNVRHVRKASRYSDAEVRLLSGGLWAGLAAYVVGAFFASTAYQLYPYYMVAYTAVLFRITSVQEAAPLAETVKQGSPTLSLESPNWKSRPGWQRALTGQRPTR
jgi:O-antigen ligase